MQSDRLAMRDAPHSSLPVSCRHCGAEAVLVMALPPAASHAIGARVYRCAACEHHTWVDWRADEA